MNRIVYTIGLILLACTVVSAQDLRAELSLARFDSPEEGPFLETYLKLKGASLKSTEIDGLKYSEVLITCKVTKAGQTIFEDAYKVKGPNIVDGNPVADFIDQQRIPIKMGKLELEMTIKDIHNPDGRQANILQDIVVEQKLLGVFLSDIQLVDSYTKTTEANILSKAGFDLVPYTSNFYADDQKSITFYVEAYNTHRKIGSDGEFLINMFLEQAEDGKIVNDLRSFQKRSGELVVPVLHSFPLEEVLSGKYNLVVEARDDKNELLDRSIMPIQRSNSAEAEYSLDTEEIGSGEISTKFVGKYNRPEELEENLRCLHPISNQEEIHHVNRKINFNDVEMMQRYMYYFWMKRDPLNPEEAWLNYKKEVDKVNAAYSTNLYKGYDTDRGRVYLQYGPPNTISPNYFEPNTYPYEIWHYYSLRDHVSADQSNRKFIFANTEQGSKEFDLIHSDAKNEINNRRWNYDLHKRSTSTIDLDQEGSGDHYGGRSQEFFENPY